MRFPSGGARGLAPPDGRKLEPGLPACAPDGREIIGKQRLNQRSYGMMAGGGESGGSGITARPALAVAGEQLYLAWTGTDHRINILADPQSPLGTPVRLEEARSKTTPALCSHQGSLVLAWCGNDGHLNLTRLRM